MKTPILQVNNVSFAYNGNRVLTDICLDVERGDFLGLIGPNGSGKTTLLKLIDGILQPQSGDTRFEDRPIQNVTRKDLAKIIAVVPQAAPLIFPFTVREVILMGRTPHLGSWHFEGARDFAVVENAMARTDTLRLANRPMDRLSGGEFHRVLIARALAQEPQILLLDEPTAYLDIRHQVDLFNLLQNLNSAQDLTVIAVTHDINLASFYCNRIALLKNGRIQAIGHPDTVVTETTIQTVYETPVMVDRHPITGRPRVTTKQESPSDNGNR